jgi:hypothetical protein
VIDIGIVAPALMVSGILLLRRAPLGYLLAAMMLVFAATLGISLIAAGIAQLLVGVISIGQAVGFTAPFAILTMIALWLTAVFLRTFSDGTRVKSAHIHR